MEWPHLSGLLMMVINRNWPATRHKVSPSPQVVARYGYLLLPSCQNISHVLSGIDTYLSNIGQVRILQDEKFPRKQQTSMGTVGSCSGQVWMHTSQALVRHMHYSFFYILVLFLNIGEVSYLHVPLKQWPYMLTYIYFSSGSQEQFTYIFIWQLPVRLVHTFRKHWFVIKIDSKIVTRHGNVLCLSSAWWSGRQLAMARPLLNVGSPFPCVSQQTRFEFTLFKSAVQDLFSLFQPVGPRSIPPDSAIPLFQPVVHVLFSLFEPVVHVLFSLFEPVVHVLFSLFEPMVHLLFSLFEPVVHVLFSLFQPVVHVLFSLFEPVVHVLFSLFEPMVHGLFSLFQPVVHVLFSLFQPVVHVLFSLFEPVVNVLFSLFEPVVHVRFPLFQPMVHVSYEVQPLQWSQAAGGPGCGARGCREPVPAFGS